LTTTVRVPGYASEVTRQVRISAPVIGEVVLPWWPDEIAGSNLAGIYETQDRPGRTPLLMRSGDPLGELRIGCIVATNNPEQPGNVAQVLGALRRMALARKPVTVKLASRSARYRITDLGITELDWDGTGEPSQAEVSITMTAASDAVVPVGPIKRKPRR
jgi:hypothetical protein